MMITRFQMQFGRPMLDFLLASELVRMLVDTFRPFLYVEPVEDTSIGWETGENEGSSR